MLWTVFCSGETDWFGSLVAFKVSTVFFLAALCDVNEEKVKFTHGNSCSHLHYQSAFVAFCAFGYCVFIVICAYEVLNSTNSCSQFFSRLALTDVLGKPSMRWLKMLPAGRLLPIPPAPVAARREESALPASCFLHLNLNLFFNILTCCMGCEQGSWSRIHPTSLPFLTGRSPPAQSWGQQCLNQRLPCSFRWTHF